MECAPIELSSDSEVSEHEDKVDSSFSLESIINKYRTETVALCSDDSTKPCRMDGDYKFDFDSDANLANVSLFTRLRSKKTAIAKLPLVNKCMNTIQENSTNQEPNYDHISSAISSKIIPEVQASDNVISNTLEPNSNVKICELPKTNSSIVPGAEVDSNIQIEIPAKRKKADELLREKAQKATERLRAKVEKEKQKQIQIQQKQFKIVTSLAKKSVKPGECMKFMIINIDSDLISNEESCDIIPALQSSNLRYKVNPQILPNTITWTRENQMVEHSDGMPSLKTTTHEENFVLIVMNCPEIVGLVLQNTLRDNLVAKQSVIPDKKVIIALYGMDAYFKSRRNHKRTGNGAHIVSLNKTCQHIKPQQLETQLTEIQILTGISHRAVETPHELSAMIMQYTKAIAEAPFKEERRQQEQQSEWFLKNSNRDCVRVDQDGNGLNRLWQQQLTQFNLARLETAEAIATKYPSPANLMEAYDSCSSTEGELLLQNIPIRRAYGPLTSQRKIGPELSKKVYTFFTSLDPEMTLSQETA